MNKYIRKYIVKRTDSTILLTNQSASVFWESEEKQEKEKAIQFDFLESTNSAFFSYPVIEKENVNLFGFSYNNGSNKDCSKVKDFPAELRHSSTRLPVYVEENERCTSGLYDYQNNEYIMRKCLLVDHGDLSSCYENPDEINEYIARFLYHAHSRNTKFCVLGGDHSITYILLSNLIKLLNKKIILFHFDAHHDCGSDILKLDNTVTHGNFVRFLLQHEMIAGVVQIGVRGLRSLGQKFTHPKLFQIQPTEIEKLSTVMEKIHEENNKKNLCGYISFDVDVLDPKDFPLVEYPKINGPEFQDVINMIKSIFELPTSIIGVDIVEGKSGGKPEQYDPILHIMAQLLEGLTN